jgi:hypothetical protein
MSLQSLFPNIKIYEITKETNPNSERYTVPYIEKEASLIIWILWARKRKHNRGKELPMTSKEKKIISNWYIDGYL